MASLRSRHDFVRNRTVNQYCARSCLMSRHFGKWEGEPETQDETPTQEQHNEP